jgi:hypothetical protein
MLRHIAGITVVCLVLPLAGCQKKEAPPAAATDAVTAAPPAPPAPVVVQDFLPLRTAAVRWDRKAEKCKGKLCAEVHADFVSFPDNPALSSLLEKELAALAADTPMAAGDASVSDFANRFLHKAGKRYGAWLNAKVLRQSGALLALQLDTSVYSGGAHGQPATRFLNYDRRQSRVLALDDVVKDGARPALVAAAREAHAAWKQEKGFTDTGFDKTWPFVETDNFTLAEKGLLLKYQAYAIAPYSEGQPELLLPYAELQGILKPEWLLPAP